MALCALFSAAAPVPVSSVPAGPAPAANSSAVNSSARLLSARSRNASSSAAWTPGQEVVVAGVQKAGTTFLFALIEAVLQIRAPTKELHIFDTPRGCAYDPEACRKELEGHAVGDWYLDGTPLYFNSLSTLIELQATLPQAKVLLTFRDPIDRARSAWDQNVRGSLNHDGTLHFEPRAFSGAISDELEAIRSRCRCEGDECAARLMEGEPWRLGTKFYEAAQKRRVADSCVAWQSHCWLAPISKHDAECKRYVVRGLYARQLRVWRQTLGSRLLVFRLEDLADEPLATAERIASHLGTPLPLGRKQLAGVAGVTGKDCWHNCNQEKHDPERIDPATEAALVALYAEDQRELAALEPRLAWPRWGGKPPPATRPPLASRPPPAAPLPPSSPVQPAEPAAGGAGQAGL